MNISLGMVVRDFISPQPLLGFIENAHRYGHNIYSVVVAYSHSVSPQAINRLSQEVMVYPIQVNQAEDTARRFDAQGISEKTKQQLLYTPWFSEYGMVPYGFNRNLVVMEAILTGSDVLLFVDSDIYPRVLMKGDTGPWLAEIDFVGSHIQAMYQGAQLTSSEYSGYNILPPMAFDGLEHLLRAVQKDDMLPWLAYHETHNCLALQQDTPPQYSITGKILGGNLGIDLSVFRTLPPFYSTVYTLDGTAYLGRGEDTILSLRARETGIRCVDTGTYLFHDTFDNYPVYPNLRQDPAIQQRFFYACMGWIGRNPFYNWLRDMDTQALREEQYHEICKGANALVAYTGNQRFALLPQALQASYDSLPAYRESFRRTVEAWSEFRERSGF